LALLTSTHTGYLYQIQITNAFAFDIWHEIIELVQSNR
jgi:hypothetical protein